MFKIALPLIIAAMFASAVAGANIQQQQDQNADITVATCEMVNHGDLPPFTATSVCIDAHGAIVPTSSTK